MHVGQTHRSGCVCIILILTLFNTGNPRNTRCLKPGKGNKSKNAVFAVQEAAAEKNNNNSNGTYLTHYF